MTKLLLKIIYIILCVGLLVYVLPPSQGFPAPPPGATQSDEPADTETPLRRAYFTDLTREEIMKHYKENFAGYPTLSLNYPPEEAQTIIRDQTRSSYLEELVHPFRESVYVSGFVPEVRKDAVVIAGREYYQKVIVRYVPSSQLTRALFVISVSFLGYFTIAWSGKILVNYTLWLRKELWQILKRQ